MMDVWSVLELDRGGACRARMERQAMAELARIGADRFIRIATRGGDCLDMRTNLPEDWARGYERSVHDGRDPFMRLCMAGTRPVLTGADRPEGLDMLPEDARALIRGAAEETRCRAGFSIVTRCAGSVIGWNVLSTDWRGRDAERALRRWASDIRLMLGTLDACAAHPEAGRDMPKLTPREIDCLTLVASGRRVAAIGHALGISDETVSFHLRNGRRRLGARTRDEAIVIALRAGLIHP